MRVRSMALLFFFSLLCGCASKDDSAKPLGSQRVHGGGKSDPTKTFATVLKDQKLSGYSDVTIGAAFDAYKHFNKKEWKEEKSQNGKIYIDFIGWRDGNSVESIKEGVSAKGVAVKFVVTPDGAFYVAMVSKLETRTDGKMSISPLEDKKMILDAIYANKDFKI